MICRTHINTNFSLSIAMPDRSYNLILFAFARIFAGKNEKATTETNKAKNRKKGI